MMRTAGPARGELVEPRAQSSSFDRLRTSELTSPRLKIHPALDVRCGNPDLMLATVDDFSPTAVEERSDLLRVFFARSADRDAARRALAPSFSVAVIDVPDEDWARRSQEHLKPITVGRITIAPRALDHRPLAIPPSLDRNLNELRRGTPQRRRRDGGSDEPSAMSIVIPPSMGFGTGHHATTRLCLEALQAINLAGATLLDIGTGSGVLAIAAVRLGAARAMGIDVDADAIDAARENLAHNPDVAGQVSFVVDDVWSLDGDAGFDVITANLTGTLLVQSARKLLAAVQPGGVMIVSGLQTHERDDVERALADTDPVWARTADE